MRLTTNVHDRDVAGMRYVYPVVSRRAGGVSVGVNLNPNNACNWRCVYCQVPGLTFGMGPPIELPLLRRELDDMLAALTTGDYMERHVPEGSRRLNDVAFSGNGEPTSSPDFAAAVELVADVLRERDLYGELRQVLITNGSLTHQAEVQRGLRLLARGCGEVWFKLDRATDAGARAVNSNRAGLERVRANLRHAAACAPTWLQTILFARAGSGPSEAELQAWLDFVGAELAGGLELQGVLLYGLARQSHQPEAPELSALPVAELEAFAERVRALGLTVRVTP